MPSGHWIVCLGDDWGYQTSSAQQLMHELSARYSILWVNSVGMRAPRFSRRDLHRLWTKGIATPALKPFSERVTVASVRLVPLHHWPTVRALNRAIARHAAERWLSALGIGEATVVCAMPSALDIAKVLPSRRLIYYCMDDFATLPGVDWGMVGALEAELLQDADAVVVTSEVLMGLPRFHGRSVSLLTHGIDVDLFARARKPAEDAVVRLVADLPRPLLGFAGLLDNRIDIELLVDLVRDRSYGLLLIGESHVDIRKLQALPNVLILGYKPHAEIPQYLAACDILLAPYEQTDVTRALQPLKVGEYLATGKPVVATPLPALERMRDVIHLATGADEFRAVIRNLAEDYERGRDSRIAWAEARAWSVRAREFEKLIECP